MDKPVYINVLLGVILSPLLLGIINRTKAVFAGRHGQPILQTYYDVFKLLRKGAVYSRTTSWVFKSGPVVGLASALVALSIVPVGGAPSLVSFTGDFILMVYALGLMRFFTVVAALDTGSSFEGMGSSREVLFSAIAEPALLVCLLSIARETGSLSLSHMMLDVSIFSPEMIIVIAALFIVLLCENARMPVDDPNTHLELTMIHEVMVLDHSGPDFAFILYGSAIKLWTLGAIITGIIFRLPPQNGWVINAAVEVAGLFMLSLVIGIVESTMARLRLVRVPQLLVAACVLSFFAFILIMR